MNIPYVFKKCTNCGEWLVANTNNFNKRKGYKYGLHSNCRKCENEKSRKYHHANKERLNKISRQYYREHKEELLEYNKQYHKINKEKIAEQRKQYAEKNKEKKAEYDRRYREEHKEELAKQKKQYYEENKEKKAEYDKQYRKNNKERRTKQKKQYYEENKEKVLKHQKEYYQDNKEKIAKRNKQYVQSPKGQAVQFNARVKRRMKENNQGNGINVSQWLDMMNYFNWECAYSGKSIDKYNRTIDHIIPIAKGGEHEIWNLVPMYNSYNFSKNDKDMLEWYKQQSFFSEERLAKIYEWQEYAFNKYAEINDDKVNYQYKASKL